MLGAVIGVTAHQAVGIGDAARAPEDVEFVAHAGAGGVQGAHQAVAGVVLEAQHVAVGVGALGEVAGGVVLQAGGVAAGGGNRVPGGVGGLTGAIRSVPPELGYKTTHPTRLTCYAVYETLTIFFVSQINFSITSSGISEVFISIKNCPEASQKVILATACVSFLAVQCSSKPSQPALLS